ncbi:MAG: hypothetical protein IJM30_07805 [Thermoguttaceae bacterium]|nr:hypothetical protein [Thermoguttaceae bacterium]
MKRERNERRFLDFLRFSSSERRPNSASKSSLLRLEQLEERQLLSATPVDSDPDFLGASAGFVAYGRDSHDCAGSIEFFVETGDSEVGEVETPLITTAALATPALGVVSQTAFTVTLSISSVPNATSYTIQRAEDADFEYSPTTLYGYESGIQEVPNLTPGTTYYFRVQAVGAGYDDSDWSNVEVVTTPTLPLPTPVVSLTGQTYNSATLNISPVPNAGRYAVEYTSVDDSFTANVTSLYRSAGSQKITGLSAATTYYFRVKATPSNAAEYRDSDYTTTISTTTNLRTPTLSYVQNSKTSESVQLTIGNVAKATAYVLEYATDANFSSIDGTESFNSSGKKTISGLSPATEYYFRVKATGENYPDSVYSTNVSETTLPIAPGFSIDSTTSSSINLTIESVGNVEKYELQYSKSADFDSFAAPVSIRSYWSDDIASNPSVTTEDLKAGTTYYFRIRSTMIGNVVSDWSTSRSATTKLSTPTLSAKAKDASSVTVTIGSVAKALGYEVEYADNDAFENSSTATISATGVPASTVTGTISGLTAGKKYYFRVKATGNAGLESDYSETVDATTKLATPTLAIIPNTNTASTVDLTIGSVPGTDIYELQWSTDPSFNSAFASVTARGYSSFGEKTITGLDSASVYYFRVKARTSAGDESVWSSAVSETTDLAVPSISFAYVDSSTVGVTIDSVPGATRYRIVYAPGAAFDPDATPLPASAKTLEISAVGARTIARTIAGLAPDTTYYFYVSASSSESAPIDATYGPRPKNAGANPASVIDFDSPIFDDSEWGESRYNNSLTTIAAPETLRVESTGANYAILSISDAYSGAVVYKIEYSADPAFSSGVSEVTATNGEEITISGLASSATYYFRAKAIVGGKQSSWYPAPGNPTRVWTTTLGSCGVPTLSDFTTSGDSATFTIGSVDGAGLYEIEYGRDANFESGTTTRAFASSGTQTIDGLAPSTRYYFRVRATSNSSATSAPSEWSSVSWATTTVATPTLAVVASGVDSATATILGSDRRASYVLQRSTDPEFGTEVSELTFSKDGAKTLGALNPSTTYYFRVKATVAGETDSPWSETIELRTSTAAPSISAIESDTTSLTFAIDALENATGYQFQYGTDPTFATAEDPTDATAGSRTISGLLPGTLYYVRVRAKLSAEDFSEDTEWTTFVATTALAAPTLTATAYSSSSIKLTIGASSTATEYAVEYSDDASFAAAKTVSFGTSGEQTINGLDPDKVYYFRVKAIAAGRSESAWSSVANARTNSLQGALVVTSTGDRLVSGTLRYALAAAAPGNTIKFSSSLKGKTITIANGELLVDKAITIDASAIWDDGTPGITIDAGQNSRVFNITADANLVGLTITGGKASEGAGILVADAASATLTRCVVSGNLAESAPGQSGTIVIARGGGIANYGDLTLESTRVENNEAIVLEGSTTAYAFGGGIWSEKTLVARDSVIEGNATEAKSLSSPANSHGAGFYSVGSATLVDCEVVGNENRVGSSNTAGSSRLLAYGGGGFVLGELRAENSRFADNGAAMGAAHKGGAIYAASNSRVVLTDETTIENNASVSFGGGVYSEGDLTISERCVLSGNASETGGALYSSGKLTMVDATVRGNLAECGYLAMGGALYLAGAATIENVALLDNVARADGVGTDVVAQGGAICARSEQKVALTNCSIRGNLVETTSSRNATSYGGGVYSVSTGRFELTNCDISDNDAVAASTGASPYKAISYGGGIYGERGLALVNASVVANSAEAGSESLGDGIYLKGFLPGDAFSLSNSVVARNGNQGSDLFRTAGTVVNSRNTLSTFTDWSNAGDEDAINFAYSPKAAAFEDFENGDYRPALDGQLMDRGDDALFPGYPSVDLDGKERISYAAIDLGAYERGAVFEDRLAAPSFNVSLNGTRAVVKLDKAIAGADSYEIDYGADPTFATRSTAIATGTSATISGIPSNVKVYFRVRAAASGRLSSVWSARKSIGTEPSTTWNPTSPLSPDANEPNDALGQATNLGTLTGIANYNLNLHSASDEDWFKISTVATGGAEDFVRVEYPFSYDGSELVLEARDARGNKVAISDEASGAQEISFNNLPAGDYWIRVKRARSADRQIQYRLTIDPPEAVGASRLERPVVAAASCATGLSVDISEVSGAVEYVVQYGTDSGFAGAFEKTFDGAGAKTLSGLNPSTLYYVRAKAVGANGLESEWSVASAKTDAERDPLEPNDVFAEARDLGQVAGGDRFESLNLHSANDVDWFQFSSVAPNMAIAITPGATSGSDLVFELFGASGERIAVSTETNGAKTLAIPSAGTEYWIRVFDASPNPGALDYALEFVARQGLSALGSPTIVGSASRTSATISIGSVASALKYVLQYDVDEEFAAPISLEVEPGSTIIDGLRPSTTYWFRVKATADGFADSEFSTISLTIGQDALSVPTLGLLESRAAGVSLALGEALDASEYVLEYSTDASFASALSKTFFEHGSAVVSDLAPGTSYHFRVKAKRDGFDDSPWSADVEATTLSASTPLDVPVISALSGAKTAIVVKIDAIEGAQKYVVEYATNSNFTDAVAKNYSSAGSKTISNLSTGTWYFVRVKAIATGRPDSAYAASRTVYTGSAGYAQPSFTFSATKTAVVLNIKPGKIDPVQGPPEKYVIEYSESPDFSSARTRTVAQGVETDGTLKPCKPTISGLTFGTVYYFRVKATGSLGNDSGWYDYNKTAIVAGQLATPTYYVSKKGSDFLNIRCYNVPAAGLAGFEAMVSTDPNFANPTFAQGSASGTVSVAGLVPGEKYYVKVRSLGDNVNRVDSSWTKIVNNATTSTPGAPALAWPSVSTTPRSSTIEVAIGEVENAAGYVVEYGTDPDFGSDSTIGVSFDSAGVKTIVDLNSETTYYVRVKAIADGRVDSRWTVVSQATNSSQLSAPSLTIVPDVSVVEVEIGSVPNASSYVLQYGTDSTFATRVEAIYDSSGAKTISDLVPGTTYYFRVKAISAFYFDSDWTTESATTLPSDALETPTYSTSSTKNAIIVTINAVEDAEQYVLDYGTDPTFETFATKYYSTTGAKTVSGLTLGTRYYCRLRATATGRPDSAFAEFVIRTAGLLPPSDSIVSSATSTAIVLSISEVEDADSYVVEYARTSSFATVLGTKSYPTPGAKTISGFESGKTYYFRVKAISTAYGESDWSVTKGTTSGAPALAVPGVECVAQGNSLVVEIGKVTSAMEYVVQYGTDRYFRAAYTTSATFDYPGSKTLPNLELGTTYYVRVKASGDDRSDSAWSTIASAKTPTSCLEVPTASTTSFNEKITVNIGAVANATSYVLQYGTDPTFTNAVNKTYASSGGKTLTGLNLGTRYYFRLKATADGYNESAWNVFEARTKGMAVPTLSSPTVDKSRIIFSIYAVDAADRYVVEYSKMTNFPSGATITRTFYPTEGKNTISVTLSSLDSGKIYYARVKAISDQFGESDWATFSAKTKTSGASASSAVLDEDSPFENYFDEQDEQDELDAFWDVLAKSRAK